MRSYLLAVMAVLASSLCEPPGAVAQIMAAGGQTQGAFGYRVMGQPLGTGTQGRFGNRVLGQPFQPPPTSMGNWVPYAASGNFMNYGTPYGSVSITGQPFLPQPVVSIGLAGVAPMPQYNLANPAEVPAPVTPPPAPETTAPEPLPETNGGAEGIAPAEPCGHDGPRRWADHHDRHRVVIATRRRAGQRRALRPLGRALRSLDADCPRQGHCSRARP